MRWGIALVILTAVALGVFVVETGDLNSQLRHRIVHTIAVEVF